MAQSSGTAEGGQAPEKPRILKPKTEGNSKIETRKEFDRGWRGFHRFLGGRSQLKVAQVFNHCCIAEFYSADRPTLPTDTVRSQAAQIEKHPVQAPSSNIQAPEKSETRKSKLEKNLTADGADFTDFLADVRS